MSRRLVSRVALLLWFSLDVYSWSLFLSKSSAPASAGGRLLAPHHPPDVIPVSSGDRVGQARTLLQHLKEGKSRFHPGITVVSVGGDECGIQLEQQREGQQQSQQHKTEEDVVIFVDRGEFITPQSGLETSVGQALQWHLSQTGNSVHAFTDKLPHIYLAIYLTLYKECLLELEPDSSVVTADYLKTLPSSLEHLPVFWQDTMLEELQCSVLQQGVKSRRDEWKQEFVLVQTALQEVGLTRLGGALSLDTWYWARAIITSRAFVDSGNNDQPCLCPYVDMMNHVTTLRSQANEEVVQCIWDIDSKGYYLRIPQNGNSEGGQSTTTSTMTTTKAPRLEISYGKHSNAQFLMNYGFSVLDDDSQEHTREDIATLPVILPKSVDQWETESLWEADGLGDCHSIARNVTVGIGNAGPMESVLSLCRVASAQQRELSCMKDNFMEQDQRTDQCEDGLVPQLGATLCRTPFSVANEIRALHMLQEATQTALGRYSTTIEQDSDMLRSGRNTCIQQEHQSNRVRPLSPLSWLQSIWRNIPLLSSQQKQNDERSSSSSSLSAEEESQWRNAVTVRREEKKILLHYFQLASIGINFLKHSEEDKDDNGNGNDNDVDLFETYKGMLEASLHDPEAFLAA